MAPNEPFALQSSDWNQEWKRIHEMREKPRDAAYWDKRASTFDSDIARSDYCNAFFDRVDVRPGESVFDMGCGTGSLAIEYAKAGHEVLAADFSSGMLAETQRRISSRGLQNVRLKLLSWEDDWAAQGVAEKSFDVAIASRSIATADLTGALAKLSAVARRYCAITLSTGGTPRVDRRALDACGIEHSDVRDYQYAMNILINKGRLPNLSYITSMRNDSFDSLEDALGVYRTSLGKLTESETAHLVRWLQDELIVNEHVDMPDGRGGKQKALRLAHPREFHWALISWSVEQ